MPKKSSVCKNWPKYLLQWGILAALLFFLTGMYRMVLPQAVSPDPEKYCPFGGLEAFSTFLQAGSLPCSMTSLQIVMGLALAAAAMLFSKLFCAFLCPVGTVEDLLFKARKAIGLRGIHIKSGAFADKLLRVVKYVLLFWIVYSTVSSSELFCKNLDPYYAVASGFKGEITLWMSLTTIGIVILLGFIIDRFWCKYICPLGAISNTMKFWTWILLFTAIWWGLGAAGLNISWLWFLGAFCLGGYLLEIICGKPKMQIIGVVIDQDRCTHSCLSCQKNCPYGIKVPSFGHRVTSVDCTLCGECVASCPTQALSIGVKPGKNCFGKYIPAILAVLITIGAFLIGRSFELPTINESWGYEDGMKSETIVVEGLRSVKCYGSSMAFKAKLERIEGVHGVKTYVGSHKVAISFNPDVISAEEVQEEIYVPTTLSVSPVRKTDYPELKVYTIRTEKMPDRLDLNDLAKQFSLTDKKIYGLESEYDCPLVVRVYAAPEESLDEAWFKETVEKKTLEVPQPDGSVSKTAVDFEFVRLEPEVRSIAIDEYIKMSFSGYKSQFAKNTSSAHEYVYQIVDEAYGEASFKNILPYLASHLSNSDGILGLSLVLNDELEPCLQVSFIEPMTADGVWSLLTAPKWTISYSEDDVREEDPRYEFTVPGSCHDLAVAE